LLKKKKIKIHKKQGKFLYLLVNKCSENNNCMISTFLF